MNVKYNSRVIAHGSINRYSGKTDVRNIAKLVAEDVKKILTKSSQKATNTPKKK